MKPILKPTWLARLRMLLPVMITPCVYCGDAAGFWVYQKDGLTVRRPWCLSCLDSQNGPDKSTIKIVRFDS